MRKREEQVYGEWQRKAQCPREPIRNSAERLTENEFGFGYPRRTRSRSLAGYGRHIWLLVVMWTTRPGGIQRLIGNHSVFKLF